MTESDIKVSLKSYRPHDPIKRGRLELVFSGTDANDELLNGLGRILVNRIPTYAFTPELIKIERINPETGYHDSVPFNHDMMRLRISNIPVMNVDPGFAFLHERYWKNVDYLDADRERHEKELVVEANIDVKNSANEEDKESIIHITTNDMKIYIDNELVELYDKEYPMLIISLKAKEAFKCSLKAVLGLGLRSSIWDACSNYCYDQETEPGKTIMKIESASRFDEFTLVDRGLEYFKLRATMLKDEIHKMYLLEKNPTEKFNIVLKNEDHTMGESINYEIQSHPDILKSSNTKPDYLIREVVINVIAFKKEKLLNAVLESIDNLINKITKIEQMFSKIDRTSVSSNITSSKTKASEKTKASKKTKPSKKIK